VPLWQRRQTIGKLCVRKRIRLAGTQLWDASRRRANACARHANTSFASLAGAKFDQIDFSDTVITANCNFHGMQDCGRYP
jgi:hypothetical protein